MCVGVWFQAAATKTLPAPPCRRLMVRHSYLPLLVHMLDVACAADAALHSAFIRRAASTILARLANRCALRCR